MLTWADKEVKVTLIACELCVNGVSMYEEIVVGESDDERDIV